MTLCPAECLTYNLTNFIRCELPAGHGGDHRYTTHGTQRFFYESQARMAAKARTGEVRVPYDGRGHGSETLKGAKMSETRQVGDRTYAVSDEVREIADEVMVEEHLELEVPKVEYVLVYPYISKSVAGRCIKASKELKFFTDFDYIIEMSGDLWQALDRETKKILTFHELLHIAPKLNNRGDITYKLRDHDVQDFKRIVDKYGTDWIYTVRTTTASVHDLDNEDEVKL